MLKIRQICTMLSLCFILAGILYLAGKQSVQASRPQNIGARQCATCHPDQYQHWLTTAHARAYQNLPEKNKSDTSCVFCHTLGKGKELDGIQCESCHGPGVYYHFDYVMKDKELSHALGLAPITKQTCMRCHTPDTPSLVPFSFAKKRLQILHTPPSNPAQINAPK